MSATGGGGGGGKPPARAGGGPLGGTNAATGGGASLNPLSRALTAHSWQLASLSINGGYVRGSSKAGLKNVFSGQKKPARSAVLARIRRDGSSVNSFCTTRHASSNESMRKWPSRLHLMKSRGFISSHKGHDSCPGQLEDVGVPHTAKIFSNCSDSDFPRNKTFPRHSSTKMQPMDHMSTSGPYVFAPRSNSGGRYHNVMTLFVYSMGMPRTCGPSVAAMDSLSNRAKPKSHSLISLWLVTRMLLNFKSRCMIFKSCRYAITEISW